MIIKNYFSFALSNLKHRSKRTWLTLIGIFIGVAAVISLIALSQGLSNAISGQFSDLGSDKITITASGLQYGAPGSYVVEPLTKEDLNIVEKVDGVKLAAGRLMRQVEVKYKDEIGYVYLASLPYKENRDLIYDTLNLEAEKGRLLKDSDKYKLLIGNNFLEENRIFSEKVVPGDKLIINNKEFEVEGVLKNLGSFQIDQSILVPEDQMKEILDIGEVYDLIVVQVQNEKELENVQKEIEKELRKHRDVEEGNENFKVQTPQNLLETLNSLLLIIQVVLIGIASASISLIVGGIGIMNTMYTSVLERTREIGIMKAVGATNRNIFMLFFVESGLIGATGGIVGILIGFVFVKIVEIIGGVFLGPGILVGSFSAFAIISMIIFSFIVGSISGTYPAIQASKLKPVEALRGW